MQSFDFWSYWFEDFYLLCRVPQRQFAFLFWSQTFKMYRILFCLVIGFYTSSISILIKNLAKLNHIMWDLDRLMDISWDLAQINEFQATKLGIISIANKNKIQFILFKLSTFHAEYHARIKCLVCRPWLLKIKALWPCVVFCRALSLIFWPLKAFVG